MPQSTLERLLRLSLEAFLREVDDASVRDAHEATWTQRELDDQVDAKRQFLKGGGTWCFGWRW